MKVLLVDDENLQLIRLENSCKKVLPEAEFFSFANPIEALKKAEETKFDLAFLDIEMPSINGVKLAKTLKKSNISLKIIFVTAYDDYALSAFKIHASGYILKPVNEEKIRAEIEELSKPIKLESKHKLQIKCFGNFEIFYNGEAVKFKYQKSKELFAYLIDRCGSLININELNAILWEEDHKSYLRNLIYDIQSTLNSLNCGDVFIKKHSECAIDTSKVDCDLYEYQNNNPDAVRMFNGEYMEQYSWAIFEEKQ